MNALRLLLVGACIAACSDEGFPTVKTGARLVVELSDRERVAGSPRSPLPLSIGRAAPFRITVRAEDAAGNVDTAFNGWVRISAKPGSIERINAPGAVGRNVRLNNGESAETEVNLFNAYGATYILADDLGYDPGNPVADPPPACANGVDDDGDGRIDFPADPGCAFANDNSESGNTYAQGASPPIFYALPRIADVRGLTCVDNTCRGNGLTPFSNEQIRLDTGYRLQADGTQKHEFDMVVIRIASDGFYVADPRDTRGGFNAVFAFNFNAPPGMRICDRLRSFAGTATEFFGFTQISYPTWTLEQWDPRSRPCLVPEPRILTPTELASETRTNTLLPLSGNLVRVLSIPDKIELKVTPKFGPNNAVEQSGVFIFEENATNCDLNKNGRIEFANNGPEGVCSQACAADPECSEYSNFIGRSVYRLTVTDIVTNTAAAITADSSSSADFKPLLSRGKALKAFSGTLSFFSGGGGQFTIEARCKDDITVDLNAQPLPSDKACVTARTDFENPE
jgi:hypothetical protein